MLVTGGEGGGGPPAPCLSTARRRTWLTAQAALAHLANHPLYAGW
ncbi:hypothetical protein ACWC9R_09855 [Streptomyces sp. NPDC001219]